jgi:hypothetical protein
MEEERIPGPTLSKTKKDDKDTKIRSQKYLRPEIRFKHHVTQVLYNAIDMAEEQIKELFAEVEELKKNQDGQRD